MTKEMQEYLAALKDLVLEAAERGEGRLYYSFDNHGENSEYVTIWGYPRKPSALFGSLWCVEPYEQAEIQFIGELSDIRIDWLDSLVSHEQIMEFES